MMEPGGAINMIKRYEYNIICNLLDKVNNVEKYLMVLPRFMTRFELP